MHGKIAALLSSLLFAAPLTAQAQDVGAPYDVPPAQTGVERIQGRVVNFDGPYNLAVRDERGFMDRVELHQGTIINPTGITLQPGMVVSIIGQNLGDYFAADEVDTPYTIYGGVPYYENHPWEYFGAGVALGVFFSSLSWWHGDYFGGYDWGWNGGYRCYNAVYAPGIWNGDHSDWYGWHHHWGGERVIVHHPYFTTTQRIYGDGYASRIHMHPNGYTGEPHTYGRGAFYGHEGAFYDRGNGERHGFYGRNAGGYTGIAHGYHRTYPNASNQIYYGNTNGSMTNVYYSHARTAVNAAQVSRVRPSYFNGATRSTESISTFTRTTRTFPHASFGGHLGGWHSGGFGGGHYGGWHPGGFGGGHFGGWHPGAWHR